MNSTLYEKQFNLKNSKIFGGLGTFKECETATSYESCADTTYDTYDDNDVLLETCTDYVCDAPQN